MVRVLGGIILAASAALAELPVDQMNGHQLIGAAKGTVAKIAKDPKTTSMDDVNKLNHIIDALDKHLPAHADSAPVSGMEQGVDTAVHAVFHPFDDTAHQMKSLKFDINHLGWEDSGWGLLKGFLVLVTLYVVIGVIVMKKVYNANGIESLPHLSFWMSYPGLVMDGVSFVMDKLGLSSATPYNSLATVVNKGGNPARDTFSQFEPI
jgi:hypothetical protein